jgi:putative transposase
MCLSPAERLGDMATGFARELSSDFTDVPAKEVRDVAHMLKAIHAQKSRETATQKAEAVVAELRRQRMHKAAELVEEKIQETLSYYEFPDSHWRKIRTNNPLERLRISRRTKVVGAFPDGKSCLNLAAARLRHVAGTEWSTRRYTR